MCLVLEASKRNLWVMIMRTLGRAFILAFSLQCEVTTSWVISARALPIGAPASAQKCFDATWSQRVDV